MLLHYQNLPQGSAVSNGSTNADFATARLPVLESTFALGSTFATPSLTNELFKKFIRTYINRVQNQAQISAEARKKVMDRPLQSRNADLYYDNSHMKCYYFYQ